MQHIYTLAYMSYISNFFFTFYYKKNELANTSPVKTQMLGILSQCYQNILDFSATQRSHSQTIE